MSIPTTGSVQAPILCQDQERKNLTMEKNDHVRRKSVRLLKLLLTINETKNLRACLLIFSSASSDSDPLRGETCK